MPLDNPEIQALTWDSEFFGYPVGRLQWHGADDFDFEAFKAASRTFRLVYLFSPEALTPKPPPLILADVKVVFRRTLPTTLFPVQANLGIRSFDPAQDSQQQAEQLALDSGLYSRYKTDANFLQDEFKRLYQRWINASLKGENAKAVLISGALNQLTGLSTLGQSNERCANIGLFAVSAQERGKGLGKALLAFSMNEAIKYGYREIEVATQEMNKPAVGLYQQAGMHCASRQYVYHYWNL